MSRPSSNKQLLCVATMCLLCSSEREGVNQVFSSEKILFILKLAYVRPLRSETKHDNCSSFSWSVVYRTDNFLDVSRTAASRVMAAYTNLGKVPSAKHNTGRKSKLRDCDRRVLKRTVAKNCKTTLPQVTFEMNTHLLSIFDESCSVVLGFRATILFNTRPLQSSSFDFRPLLASQKTPYPDLYRLS